MMRREPPRNALVRFLPLPELRRLCPLMTRMDLLPGETLEDPDGGTGGAWFPEVGFVSVLAGDARSGRTEVAMVGPKEAIVLENSGRTPWRLLAQHRGHAHLVSAEHMPAALAASPALPAILSAASAALFDQVAATAHANARGRLAERLARWLVMAHDRIEGDVLHLTHEMVAAMLGVRRVGVTNALHVLEGGGLIRADRGRVRIRDRYGLMAAANGFYRQLRPIRPARADAPVELVVTEPGPRPEPGG